MIPTRIGEYLIAAVVIILAPGPSVLFVIARAIAWGRRVAVLTVLGNASGALALSIVVALGFGPLLSCSDLLYAAVQWGGGLYLLYLGIDAWRKRAAHAADMSNAVETSEPTLWQCVRDGFWVGALNPKGIVFSQRCFHHLLIKSKVASLNSLYSWESFSRCLLSSSIHRGGCWPELREIGWQVTPNA